MQYILAVKSNNTEWRNIRSLQFCFLYLSM